MGIAWFDDGDLAVEDGNLRLGGLPWLGETQGWPRCVECGVPMLFRGQIPLALTSLVGPSDGRLLSIFECHAQLRWRSPATGLDDGGSCLEGSVVVTRGSHVLRHPPAPDRFDVVLDALGPDEASVQRVMEAFWEQQESANDNHEVDPSPRTRSEPPVVMMSNVTNEIGHTALSMVQQLGASGRLAPVAPTTLMQARSGRLVPYDDGTSARMTTLAPLLELSEQLGRKAIRGLIGGATPGYRDYAHTCSCGRPTKTAVRLLGDTHMKPVALGPAVAQFCMGCGNATLLRTG